MTPSGWEVSFDCDEEVTVSPMEPVLDARAIHEDRFPRFGWDPSAYAEFRSKCQSAGKEMTPELIAESARLSEARKIQVFASREADGRIKVSLFTRPEDRVPQDVVEDVGRLLELLDLMQPHRLDSPETKERLRHLLHERFPTLTGVNEHRLLRAAFMVLREPRAWQEGMPPEDRVRYLATAAFNALKELKKGAAEEGRVKVGKAVVDQWDETLDEALPAEDPNPLARLLARELAAKARALDLRAGERQILELVLTEKADTWTAARDMADLPDSYRVGLLKKLKALAG